ncbi:glutamyl-tRNA amidotransferase [Meredithblackwellia eburnea MCA 4105]
MRKMLSNSSKRLFGGKLCTCQAHLSSRASQQVARFISTETAYEPTPSFSSPIPRKSKSRKGKEVDRWPGWNAVIGLELHVQLKGNIKLLSGARAVYEADPNTHTAPFEAALPGSLPVLRPEAVKLALQTCLALDSIINQASKFDRKHYFYPDLPSGFQVTQKYSPIAQNGNVNIRLNSASEGRPSFNVGIEQIQLEQDTAKSFHDPPSGMTLVDLNRAGAALVEIVTRPDMRTPEEAAAFVRSLQSILRHVGASDANMEKGELRCDVNVSVNRSDGSGVGGSRCEIKNLNGVRFLVGAINSEIRRQIQVLESGGLVEQSTRGYDAVANETFHLRSKEDAPDYRYMPDPELGAVIITDAQIAEARQLLPELPTQSFDRLQEQYGLTPRESSVLVSLGEGLEGGSDTPQADIGVRFFEQVALGRDPKIAANWVIHELLGQLSKAELSLGSSPISPDDLGFLIDQLANEKLTGTVAKSTLGSFITAPQGRSFRQVVEGQLSAAPSSQNVISLCEDVINSLPVESEKVRNGQGKVLMRLVGEVMKRSGGRADAKTVAMMLKKLLGV